MFKGVTVRFKIILAFLLIAGILAGASITQIASLQQFDNLLLGLIDNNIERLRALEKTRTVSVTITKQTYNYHHELSEGEQSEAAVIKTDLLSLHSQLKTSGQTYRGLVKDDIDSTSKKYADELGVVIDRTTQKSLDMLSTSNTDETKLEAQETLLTDAQYTLDTLVAKVTAYEQIAVDTKDSQIDRTVAGLITTTITRAFIVTILATALGLIVAHWISQAVGRLNKGAVRIANGDFSQPLRVTSHDELGQLAGAFNAMSDRLKESYRRLNLEQLRDVAMLQSMGEGMVAINDKEQIVLINHVAMGLLGLEGKAEPIGKSIHDTYQLYDKGDQPLAHEVRPFVVALTTGAPVEDVYIFRREDGKKYLLNVTAAPVKIEGKAVGAIMVLRDVTKEKEVDRMKTEFISLASHQLRTPLSAIKWFSEMLVAGDAGVLKPDQLDFAKNIADSTERMIALVNALLNISRIESGRILVDPKPTDLKELVAGITNDLKAKTEQKHQTLIISVHADLPKINLDPHLIGQVYLNLLTNAIKYTPEGGEISVFISKKDDQVISQVTDNGYGIPKAQQDRVFQKFFRATNAVKVETDGTGLGLYLIRSIVESSGGKIWFESKEGAGSTFWFSIPLSGMTPKAGEVTLDA